MYAVTLSPLACNQHKSCVLSYSVSGRRWCVSTGATYSDPGATASDNVDGNLTSSLATYGIGAVSTSTPTGTTYFTITYTVQVPLLAAVLHDGHLVLAWQYVLMCCNLNNQACTSDLYL